MPAFARRQMVDESVVGSITARPVACDASRTRAGRSVTGRAFVNAVDPPGFREPSPDASGLVGYR